MSQILPASNGFDWGTGLGSANGNYYGTHQSLYFGCRMSASSWLRGILHDGWSITAPSLGIDGRLAVACPTDSVSLTNHTNRHQRRGFVVTHPTFQDDAKVSATFLHYGVTAPVSTNTWGGCGVMARVRDPVGTPDSIGKIAYSWRNCSGYVLELFGEGGSDPDFLALILRRYNGGSFTTLDEKPIGIAAVSSPISLSLRAETTGGIVRLTYTISGGGLSGEVEFTYDDSSGSKITGNGRPGFFMFPTRTSQLVPSNPVITTACSVFQVEELGSVVWRDQFERTNPAACYQTDVGPTPFPGLPGLDGFLEGASLQSSWYWDNHTYWPLGGPEANAINSSQSGRRFLRDANFETAYMTSQGESGSPQFPILSQRPAGDPRSQHRLVDLTFLDTPSSGESYTGGIVLRATQATPTTNPGGSGVATGLTAYACYFIMSPTQTILIVSRWNGGSNTVIGSLIESHGSTTYLPEPTDTVTLDFDVYTTGDPLEGTVELVVEVDGVRPTLNAQSFGLSSPADGVLQDSSSQRVLQGWGEGLWFSTGFTETSDNYRVRFDAWNEGTLTNAFGVIADDQASETVQAEDANSASSDLSDRIRPDFPFTEEILGNPIRHEFESGASKQYPRGVDTDGSFKARRRWRFFKANALNSEYDDLMAYWKQRENGTEPFQWTPIEGGDTYTVVFGDDTISQLVRFKDTHSLSFSLVEVG